MPCAPNPQGFANSNIEQIATAQLQPKTKVGVTTSLSETHHHATPPLKAYFWYATLF
jgi:hypothetical protein